MLSGSTATDLTLPCSTTMAYRLDLSPPKMADPSHAMSSILVNLPVGSAKKRI